MIRKVKEGYRVVVESGRNMGTYQTREEAKNVCDKLNFSNTKRNDHNKYCISE